MLGMMMDDSVRMISQAILLLPLQVAVALERVQALPPPLLFLHLLSVEVGVAPSSEVPLAVSLPTSSEVALPLPLSLPLALSGVQGMVQGEGIVILLLSVIAATRITVHVTRLPVWHVRGLRERQR